MSKRKEGAFRGPLVCRLRDHFVLREMKEGS